MNSKHLATYLNDHLAGSITAIELAEHIASAYAGTDAGRFASELRDDILADRKELEQLMERLSVAQSTPRKTAAWLAEKFAEVKLRLDDIAGGSFRLFIAAEVLSLGIEGKRSLWCALREAVKTSPEFAVADYDRLIQRAQEQRERVEAVRLRLIKEL